ncbi:UNVERIFIED_CONTAM: hypothetical protein Slati_1932700 [Sesamum latifolium]|uniref:Reverse transcriptase domain-containing protein n=1 Tax=Sesamum latifolium TaxID=2727402 RepID=A0AAW2X2H7_9LAMI
MMVSILIHGLKKGPLASALAKDPPEDAEQLMRVTQKYINEEEINAMKDGEWQRSKDRGRWKDSREKHVRTDKERDPYRPKFHRYMPLATTRTKALMMVEKSNLLQWPQHTRFTPAKKYSNKYCKFHKEKGHDTKDCYQLKDEIKRLARQGYFKEYKLERGDESRDRKVGDRRTRSRSRSRDKFRGKEMEDRRNIRNRDNVPVKGVINTIVGGPGGGDSRRMRKQFERTTREDRRKEWVMNVETEEEITFNSKDLSERQCAQDESMVIKLDIANFSVHKVLVDNGSSADIIFWDVLKRMGLEDSTLCPVHTPLVRFGGSEVASMGTIDLPVSMGEEPRRRTTIIRFLIVDTPFAYNVILGRPGLNLFRAVVSTYHQKMKFPTKNGIGEVSCDQKEARRCYNLSLRKGEQKERSKRKEKEEEEKEDVKKFKPERMEPVERHKLVELVVGEPDKTTRIGF